GKEKGQWTEQPTAAQTPQATESRARKSVAPAHHARYSPRPIAGSVVSQDRLLWLGFEPTLSSSQGWRITGLSYVLCCQVGREALESSSPDLQPGATPSQLPTHTSTNHSTHTSSCRSR